MAYILGLPAGQKSATGKLEWWKNGSAVELQGNKWALQIIIRWTTVSFSNNHERKLYEYF